MNDIEGEWLVGWDCEVEKEGEEGEKQGGGERNGGWREGREQGTREKERQRDSNDWPEE